MNDRGGHLEGGNVPQEREGDITQVCIIRDMHNWARDVYTCT